jgi:ParB family transcriptional regulator, chromosome partitioning protein
MTRPRRQRLGRGLGALLGDEYLATSAEGTEVRTLPIPAIAANPFQPRREFRPEELSDLERSIRENGLLQPLVVRPAPGSAGDRYQLVAGERRLRAVTALSWDSVPAVVRDVDDRTLLVLALVENIQRESLSPLEEAEGYRVLLDEFSLTQGEVAEAVGRSRSSVANALRLLRLPPSVRRLLEDESLSMGHARALLAIEDPGRLTELARRAARQSWSVREVEARVRRLVSPTEVGAPSDASSRPAGPGTATSRRDPAIAALEEELRHTLGTRVVVKGGREGGEGSIEIPFTSASDLERVFQVITGREAAEVLS